MTPNNKYTILSDQSLLVGTHQLFRIQALRDVGPDVKAGDLGGYVDHPNVLSHGGACWIYPDAKAFAGARIRDNAQLRGQSKAFGEAHLRGDARLLGRAQVAGRVGMQDHDTLDGAGLLLNVTVTRKGQFVVEGTTQFTFSYALGGLGVSATVSASQCAMEMAQTLSLLAPGDTLSFIQAIDGKVYPVLPRDDGSVRFEDVQALLMREKLV